MISPQVESALKGEGPLTHRAYTAAFTNSGEFFQVQSQLFGLVWVESRNVRLCSGLGCTCEPISEVQA